MSAEVPDAAGASAGHPIRLLVTDDLRRSRLTVFFRLLLAIPHFVWMTIWGIAVWLVVLVAWLVGVVTGRVPVGLHGFMASYLRYVTHVSAYTFLAANPFPAFGGGAGYPVDVTIAAPVPQSRLTVFFRLLLAIPAWIVLAVLNNVAQLIAFIAWFIALITGTIPQGLRDILAYWLRYNAQTIGYMLLLTQRYPSFSDD